MGAPCGSGAILRGRAWASSSRVRATSPTPRSSSGSSRRTSRARAPALLDGFRDLVVGDGRGIAAREAGRAPARLVALAHRAQHAGQAQVVEGVHAQELADLVLR